MIKVAYKVIMDDYQPRIVKVDITDLEGVSWKDAKKQARAWYLDRAKAFRSLREKDIV